MLFNIKKVSIAKVGLIIFIILSMLIHLYILIKLCPQLNGFLKTYQMTGSVIVINVLAICFFKILKSNFSSSSIDKDYAKEDENYAHRDNTEFLKLVDMVSRKTNCGGKKLKTYYNISIHEKTNRCYVAYRNIYIESDNDSTEMTLEEYNREVINGNIDCLFKNGYCLINKKQLEESYEKYNGFQFIIFK